MDPSAILPLRARRDPGGDCLADLTGRLTNQQTADWVDQISAALVEEGLTSGDVIGTILPNRLEMVTLLFAAWQIGVAVTPVNPALTPEEAGHQLRDAAASLVVVDPASRATVAGLDIPTWDVDDLAGLPAAPPVACRTDVDDVALIVYTSGTTGRPKGVVLDRANLAAMTQMLVDWLELSAVDRCLLVLPLFHVNGIMASVVAPLAAGGSTVVAPGFDAEDFWAWVEQFDISYFSAVPTIYLVLNALDPAAACDTSSVRFAVCGAAPMPVQAITSFQERYGIPIIEGYGLSEGTVASTINPVQGPRKAGTVGPALPGQQVAVVDPDSCDPCDTGAVGEVVIAGPNVMRGYLNRPQQSRAALRDGWLHTGDVGYLDDDGYLTLVDRTKDMLIWGGENIYPKEIEEVLYTDPAVLEAAVVGRPHEVYGQEPVAFVSTRPGQQLDIEALLARCRDRLARFKLPRDVIVLDSLPKNSVGKLVKGPLRERVNVAKTTPSNGR